MTCIEGFWVKLASCEQIESKLVSWKCGREPIILTSPLIQNTEWVENLRFIQTNKVTHNFWQNVKTLFLKFVL